MSYYYTYLKEVRSIGVSKMSVVQNHLNVIWNQTLSKLKEGEYFDDIVYNTYIIESSLYDLKNDIATILVRTNMQKLVFDEEKEKIKKCLEEVIDQKIECEFFLEKETLNKVSFQSNTDKSFLAQESNYDKILPEYTFESFIVGNSNRESHSAALACAMHPGKFYNPLFIFGNSGLGKTHLLYSVGNYIKKNNPEKKVLYVNSSDFVTNVVNSIRNNSIEEFKDTMNNLDVLLVDDIQFLAGKEKSHEIFFHLFNELVNNRKQIVLTSDRHPTEIKGLEERLISRFSSGLSVGLDSPEFETSLAILQQKIEKHSVDSEIIDEDVLSYLATNFSKDVRKLEGALNRLIFYSINFGTSERIDFRTAINAFKGQNIETDRSEITVNTIKKCVADYYGLTKAQLISKSRTKNISTARHIAMYLCRKHLDLSFSKIGEDFGKRDHSTVMNGCDKIENLLKKDENFKIAIREIEHSFINS